MTGPRHPSFTALDTIDWDDTSSILHGCAPLFTTLSRDPALLTSLVTGIVGDPGLAELCESYDFMHKLVLHDAHTSGVRVRLHLYEPGFFDRPHNHRWSFASHILRGGYRHRIYGRDDNFGEDTDPAGLVPIHERLEHPGSTYALHHTSVHTVHAEADTLSLLVRGPSVKKRFLILDATAGIGTSRSTPAAVMLTQVRIDASLQCACVEARTGSVLVSSSAGVVALRLVETTAPADPPRTACARSHPAPPGAPDRPRR